MSRGREEGPDYQSYLLRLWRTHSGAAPVWRASLEEPLTQEVRRFDDLPGLVAFLFAQTEQGTPGGQGEAAPPQT
jgi:hypothetical protein